MTRTETSPSRRRVTASDTRARSGAAASASWSGSRAPPLLAATVVGAAAGGVLSRIADHKMEQGLHDKLGAAMKPGTAAIIAMFNTDQRLAVGKSTYRITSESVVTTDKKGTAALKGSLAEAMGKFDQDRFALPITRPHVRRRCQRGLRKDSVADWLMAPDPRRPRGRPMCSW